MAKNEHVLFQDIPSGSKNGTFHSAILTTYAIDLIHFDGHVRPTLHNKQISSINILADDNQLDNALKYVCPQYLTHIGKDYCVTGIESKGAFHPKINFFAGYDAVMVLIGSGNLTVTGHGKNHETFTGFMINADDDRQRPLIEECWRFINSFSGQLSDYEQKRIKNEIPDNCCFLDADYPVKAHWLHDVADGMQAALLYNEPGYGIMMQIADLVPTNEVINITVSSPYFDEDGATLTNIIDLCPNARMNVLIQASCSLPPYNMKHDPRIHFYDFDKTRRGKTIIKNYDRPAHAKLYVFETADRTFFIVGSANATKAGLGTLEKRGVNEELCVLYASQGNDFIGDLGLKSTQAFTIGTFNPPLTNEVKQTIYKVKLKNAWYDGEKLNLRLEGPLPENAGITLDDGINMQTFQHIRSIGSVLTLKADLRKSTVICYVTDGQQCQISNKIIVNRIPEIEMTNPSPEIRELNRVIYKIESEGYCGLEVANMLSDVMWRFTQNTELRMIRNFHSYNPESKADGKLPAIKYDPAFDNDDANSLFAYDDVRASRLITCIEESIQRKMLSMEDDMKNEEEEGNSETGNKRSEEAGSTILSDKKSILFCKNQVASVLNKYIILLNKRRALCKQKKSSLSKEDMCYFSLSMFASMEICYLNRFHYDFQCANSREESYYKKQLYRVLDNVMENEGLESLTLFADYCKDFYSEKAADEDFRKRSKQSMKYALLYAMFFFRYAESRQFKEKDVCRAIRSLADIFGLPDKNTLKKEVQPLIERYNHVFEFRYINQTIKEMELSDSFI